MGGNRWQVPVGATDYQYMQQPGIHQNPEHSSLDSEPTPAVYTICNIPSGIPS